MFAVKLLFFVTFIVGSLADGFDFNNPETFLISVVDQNGKQIYSGSEGIDSVGFTPETDYVTVTASKDGDEKFNEQFRTSIHGNGPMCNYALFVSSIGYAHYKSSSSSNGCNQDENTVENRDLVAFDNQSANKFYPSFAKDGQVFAADSVNGFLEPGFIRIYTTDDAYLSAPAVNINSGDVISTAVFDPYVGDFVTCTENEKFLGQVIMKYKDKKCEAITLGNTGASKSVRVVDRLKAINRALRAAFKEVLKRVRKV